MAEVLLKVSYRIIDLLITMLSFIIGYFLADFLTGYSVSLFGLEITFGGLRSLPEFLLILFVIPVGNGYSGRQEKTPDHRDPHCPIPGWSNRPSPSQILSGWLAASAPDVVAFPHRPFFDPRLFLLLSGLVLLIIPSFGIVYFYGIGLDIHTMVLGSLLSIQGFGIFTLGLFSRLYATLEGFDESEFIRKLLSLFSLNKGLLAGMLIAFTGMFFNVLVVYRWASHNFILDNNLQLRPALWGLTLMVLGIQIVFASFFISFLLIKEEYPR